jgi:tetratricopeptide (TPR) repeat protein
VTVGFCIAAAAMVGLSLVALLGPLLQPARRARPGGWWLPLLLGIALPASTAGLYRLLGTPAALSGASRPVAAAASGAADPAGTPAPSASLQAWMDKAGALEDQAQPAQAHRAYAQALQIAPGNGDAMVGWIATDLATRTDPAIDPHTRQQLQQVVAREPDNQRGLWLLGISDFQQHQYNAAATHWRRLHALLDQDTPLRKAVADKIAQAQSMADAPAVPRAGP